MAAATLTKREKKICRNAAKILEEKEHAQGHYGDGRNSVCMMGALYLAAGMKLEDYPANRFLMVESDTGEVIGLLNKTVLKGPFGVCAFNNESTKEECVAQLLELSA